MTLYILHLGKTGGTAINRVLRHDLGLPDTPYGSLKLPSADGMKLENVPEDAHVMFCVRDPIARFASAFYSRHRKGLPRYYSDWTDKERPVFERFPTPQALAAALGSDDEEERAAAQNAMTVVRHVKPMSKWLGSPELLDKWLDRILYIGRQETLTADFQHIRRLLELPADAALPSDPVAAHRGDATANRKFTPAQEAALREWYADDYAIVDWCEELRRDRGWGVPIPGAPPGMAPEGTALVRHPVADEPVDAAVLRRLADEAPNAKILGSRFLQHIGAQTVAEVGFEAGKFALQMLNECPSVDTYFLLEGVVGENARASSVEQVLEATQLHEQRRVVLDGTLANGLERIPDESLDVLLLGTAADLSLRGVTLALQRGYRKVRPDGWIAGLRFTRTPWQPGRNGKPAFLFPYAVHFAEAVGERIYVLPKNFFLLEKGSGGFELVDIAGGYAGHDPTKKWRRPKPAPEAAPPPVDTPAPEPPPLSRRALRRLRRVARR